MSEKTPEQKRTDWRTLTSRALAVAIPAVGLSQVALHRLVGTKSPKVVQKWCEPEEPHMAALSDLALFPRELVRVVLRPLLAEHKMTLVDVAEAAASVGDHVQALALFLRESGELATGYATALADGTLTPEERREVLAHAYALRDVLLGLIARLEADDAAERAALALRRTGAARGALS